MTDSDAVSIRRLVDGFEPESKLLRTWKLVGGVSAHITAFEIERRDGTTARLIARRPNAMRSAAEEFRVLTALRVTGLPVPPPHHLSPDGACLVVGYIEGEPDLDPSDPPAYLRRHAEALARIHGIDPAGFGLRIQSRDHSDPPDVLKESLREGEICKALAANPPLRANPSVLRHGDLWPGNVLWRDGEVSGLLDWEEACVGDPLADLAICRLDLLWVLGPEAMDEFTGHYAGLTGVDLADLPYWDLCASLRPIANLHEWAPNYPKLGRPDVTEATMGRDHGIFVARALEKIRKHS